MMLNCSINKFEVIVEKLAKQSRQTRSYTLEVDLIQRMSQSEGLYWNKIMILLEHSPELYIKLPSYLRSHPKIIQHVINANRQMISVVSYKDLNWLHILSVLRDHPVKFEEYLAFLREGQALEEVRDRLCLEIGSDIKRLVNKVHAVFPFMTGRKYINQMNHRDSVYDMIGQRPIYFANHMKGRFKHSHYQKILSMHGNLLSSIDPDNLNVTLCIHAVHQSGQALQYVPSQYLQFSVLQAALKSDWAALYYVQRDWLVKYPQLLLETLKANPDHRHELCSYPAVQSAIQKSALLQFVLAHFFEEALLSYVPEMKHQNDPDALAHECLQNPQAVAALGINVLIQLIPLMGRDQQHVVVSRLPVIKRVGVSIWLVLTHMAHYIARVCTIKLEPEHNAKTSSVYETKYQTTVNTQSDEQNDGLDVEYKNVP